MNYRNLVLVIFVFVFLFGCSKDSTTNPDNPVITPVQTKMLDMINILGLTTVSESTLNIKNSDKFQGDIAKGSILQFSYHDNFTNTDFTLKLNQELSTKDTLVFDGTLYNTIAGQVRYIRHTISQSEDGIIIKKQSTRDDKPPSKNSSWVNEGTFEYIPTTGGIAEYKIKSDGSKMYESEYISKTPTSITQVYESGIHNYLTNISIVVNK